MEMKTTKTRSGSRRTLTIKPFTSGHWFHLANLIQNIGLWPIGHNWSASKGPEAEAIALGD